jgi:hypothetical protein
MYFSCYEIVKQIVSKYSTIFFIVIAEHFIHNVDIIVRGQTKGILAGDSLYARSHGYLCVTPGKRVTVPLTIANR